MAGPYKIVGIDDDGLLPDRAMAALDERYTSAEDMDERISNLVVDATDYVPLDGVTDVGPGIQAMVDKAAEEGIHGGILWFPAGEYYWNSTVYMNDTSSWKWRSWIIQGAGRSTRFNLGPGLEGGYAIHVNSAGTGLPGPRKLTVRDVSVWGDTSDRPGPSKRSFVRSDDCSAVFEDLYFSAVWRGLMTTGYTDHAILDRIVFRWAYDDGALYYATGNGDACTIRNVSVSPHGHMLANLSNRQGVSIENCISGSFKLDRCMALITGCHNDMHSAGPLDAFHFIQSNVVMESNWMNGSEYRNYIVIDDQGENAPHRPTYDFRNNFFSRMIASDVNVAEATGFRPEIYIKSVANSTRVTFSNNSGHYIEGGNAQRRWAPFELRSDVNAIQNVYDADPSAILSQTTLANTGKGWGFRSDSAVSDRRTFESQNGAPTVTSARNSSYSGRFNFGASVSYIVVVYQDEGRELRSQESEVAYLSGPDGTQQNYGILLTVDTNASPCFVRVLRSVGSDGYIEHVDVPIDVPSAVLVDSGRMLSGTSWKSNSPGLRPGASATNHTINGELVASKMTVYASSAPTGGSWSVGDRVINTGSGSAAGWRCTSAGSPGTWTTF